MAVRSRKHLAASCCTGHLPRFKLPSARHAPAHMQLPASSMMLLRGCWMLQVAKKHAEEMPLESTLPGVAAAAKVSVSAVQAELQDLGASCTQLRRLLDSLSASGADAFVEVRRWFAWDRLPAQ